jgi:PKD repeat protein
MIKNFWKIFVGILVFFVILIINGQEAEAITPARMGVVGASVGSEMMFAGGDLGSNNYSGVVNIYNTVTNVWTSTLIAARKNIVASSLGDKIAFMGGQIYIFASGAGILPSFSYNIYDASTNSWWSGEMPHSRTGHAVAILGSKIFVGGGYSYTWDKINGYRRYSTNIVDIFDVTTHTWSTGNLNQARSDLAATSVCGKVIFAGGTNDVDIYDSSTNTWTTSTLSLARRNLSAATVGNKAYFMGGYLSGTTTSDRIDIYDCATNTWSIASMPNPQAAGNKVGVIGTKIYLSGRTTDYNGGNYNNIIDIFDTRDGSWDNKYVSDGTIDFGITNLDNTIYFAGGYGSMGYCCVSGYSSLVRQIEIPINQFPIAYAGTNQIIDEGGYVELNGSGSSDPDGILDIVSYVWNFGDGSTQNGVNTTHIYADNGVYTATLTVSDSVGHTSSDTATVTVNNVSPVADFAISSQIILQGQSSILSFSNPYDPSSADTMQGFTYSYDCTGDGIYEVVDSISSSYSCDYPNSGVYYASGKIKDKDGGNSDYLTNITVQTPAQALTSLIDTVQTFNLQQGISNSLDTKLETAVGALSDINVNNDQAAINSLQAFIYAVEAQRGNKITNYQADILINSAQKINNYLSLL